MLPWCTPKIQVSPLRTNSKTQVCQMYAKALDVGTQHAYIADVRAQSQKTRTRAEKGGGHEALEFLLTQMF